MFYAQRPDAPESRICSGSLSAVRRAMDMARRELEEGCGIIPEGIAPPAEKEEVDPNQFSIFEVIVIPRRIARPVAA